MKRQEIWTVYFTFHLYSMPRVSSFVYYPTKIQNNGFKVKPIVMIVLLSSISYITFSLLV